MISCSTSFWCVACQAAPGLSLIMTCAGRDSLVRRLWKNDEKGADNVLGRTSLSMYVSWGTASTITQSRMFSHAAHSLDPLKHDAAITENFCTYSPRELHGGWSWVEVWARFWTVHWRLPRKSRPLLVRCFSRSSNTNLIWLWTRLKSQ